MKMKLLHLVLLLFPVNFSLAQTDGALLAKSAAMALASYKSDTVNNSAKLEEATNLIDQALKSQEEQAIMSVWLLKGNIYNTRLQSDMIKRQPDHGILLTGDNDALIAYEAYKKVYGLSQLKYEIPEAVKGISEVQGHLINSGFKRYEEMEYEKSFLSLLASFESHELLKKNGYNSLLDNQQQLEDLIYVTGLAATQAKRCHDAIEFYNKLYSAGTNKSAVYEGLYNCKQQLGDEAGALQMLLEGRKKFPDDAGLLFAEINFYLKAGKLDELTGLLEQAIAKEPGNISLYMTLGNVYDNLYQSALKNNDEPKANANFENAKRYYTDGLIKDPKNLEANYSLGALYFNKAAILTQQMNALPDDYSTEGLKKLSDFKSRIMGLFDKAVPYFKNAESINPNDLNTLIALIEIYSRKEDLVISGELKKRLEIVRDGGKNSSPYFQ